MNEKLALLATEHPEYQKSIDALIEAFDEKSAEGMQLKDIDEELETAIRSSTRKPTRDTLLEKLLALRRETPSFDPIAFTELHAVTWHGQTEAFRFLRGIATSTIDGLDIYALKDGFRTINSHHTPGNTGSRTLALIAQQESYDFTAIQRGFGAGSLAMEKLTNQSYWIGVHKRLVALNMGTIIFKVQTKALHIAQERIHRDDFADYIKLSDSTNKSVKVAIRSCSLAIVHHQEWRKQ